MIELKESEWVRYHCVEMDCDTVFYIAKGKEMDIDERGVEVASCPRCDTSTWAGKTE